MNREEYNQVWKFYRIASAVIFSMMNQRLYIRLCVETQERNSPLSLGAERMLISVLIENQWTTLSSSEITQCYASL